MPDLDKAPRLPADLAAAIKGKAQPSEQSTEKAPSAPAAKKHIPATPKAENLPKAQLNQRKVETFNPVDNHKTSSDQQLGQLLKAQIDYRAKVEEKQEIFDSLQTVKPLLNEHEKLSTPMNFEVTYVYPDNREVSVIPPDAGLSDAELLRLLNELGIKIEELETEFGHDGHLLGQRLRQINSNIEQTSLALKKVAPESEWLTYQPQKPTAYNLSAPLGDVPTSTKALEKAPEPEPAQNNNESFFSLKPQTSSKPKEAVVPEKPTKKQAPKRPAPPRPAQPLTQKAAQPIAETVVQEKTIQNQAPKRPAPPRPAQPAIRKAAQPAAEAVAPEKAIKKQAPKKPASPPSAQPSIQKAARSAFQNSTETQKSSLQPNEQKQVTKPTGTTANQAQQPTRIVFSKEDAARLLKDNEINLETSATDIYIGEHTQESKKTQQPPNFTYCTNTLLPDNQTPVAGFSTYFESNNNNDLASKSIKSFQNELSKLVSNELQRDITDENILTAVYQAYKNSELSHTKHNTDRFQIAIEIMDKLYIINRGDIRFCCIPHYSPFSVKSVHLNNSRNNPVLKKLFPNEDVTHLPVIARMPREQNSGQTKKPTHSSAYYSFPRSDFFDNVHQNINSLSQLALTNTATTPEVVLNKIQNKIKQSYQSSKKQYPCVANNFDQINPDFKQETIQTETKKTELQNSQIEKQAPTKNPPKASGSVPPPPPPPPSMAAAQTPEPPKAPGFVPPPPPPPPPMAAAQVETKPVVKQEAPKARSASISNNAIDELNAFGSSFAKNISTQAMTTKPVAKKTTTAKESLFGHDASRAIEITGKKLKTFNINFDSVLTAILNMDIKTISDNRNTSMIDTLKNLPTLNPSEIKSAEQKIENGYKPTQSEEFAIKLNKTQDARKKLQLIADIHDSNVLTKNPIETSCEKLADSTQRIINSKNLKTFLVVMEKFLSNVPRLNKQGVVYIEDITSEMSVSRNGELTAKTIAKHLKNSKSDDLKNASNTAIELASIKNAEQVNPGQIQTYINQLKAIKNRLANIDGTNSPSEHITAISNTLTSKIETNEKRLSQIKESYEELVNTLKPKNEKILLEKSLRQSPEYDFSIIRHLSNALEIYEKARKGL